MRKREAERAKKQYYQKFGSKVSRQRLKLGLTQQQLADKAGIERAFLAKIEMGRSGVMHHTGEHLKKILGITILVLLVACKPGEGPRGAIPGNPLNPGSVGPSTIERQLTICKADVATLTHAYNDLKQQCEK